MELIPAQTALKGMRKKLRLLSLALWLVVTQSMAGQIVLGEDNFEHVHFKRIQPTLIRFNQDTIHFDVNNSSSFLLLAFDTIRAVRTVSFEWKAHGKLNKDSIAQEKTREGDDAWLRIGLILSGEPDQVPELLLPHWVKQVRNTLEFSSEKMIYLIPGAWHAPGQIWSSPFSSNIDMISVPSRPMNNDWKQAFYVFPEAQQIVGLWIMADGDNTDSMFSSQLRNLVID